jgi:hypothetical protein
LLTFTGRLVGSLNRERVRISGCPNRLHSARALRRLCKRPTLGMPGAVCNASR